MVTDSQRKQIDEIMDAFNFRRVARCMKMLKWHWGSGDNHRIPTESELRVSARARLYEVCRESNAKQSDLYLMSGGFNAFCGSDGGLRLAFELDNWEAEIDPVKSATLSDTSKGGE